MLVVCAFRVGMVLVTVLGGVLGAAAARGGVLGAAAALGGMLGPAAVLGGRLEAVAAVFMGPATQDIATCGLLIC